MAGLHNLSEKHGLGKQCRLTAQTRKSEEENGRKNPLSNRKGSAPSAASALSGGACSMGMQRPLPRPASAALGKIAEFRVVNDTP